MEDTAGHKRDRVHSELQRRGLSALKVGRLGNFQVSEVDDWVRAGKAELKDE